MLWVDDEVYVLIDGIFKAMGELLVKPRVMGNMERIPVYITSKLIINEDLSTLNTKSIYLENINEQDKISLEDVIYSNLGVYVSLEEIFEKLGGLYNTKNEHNNITYCIDNKTYKLNVNITKNKILNQINELDLYMLENKTVTNNDIDLMTLSENFVRISKEPIKKVLKFNYK